MGFISNSKLVCRTKCTSVAILRPLCMNGGIRRDGTTLANVTKVLLQDYKAAEDHFSIDALLKRKA